MAYNFHMVLDRWKHKILSYAGDPELRDHLVRSGLSYKDFTLTAAQMDTLNATPVEILSAPGSGLINLVHSVLTFVDAGTVAFELGVGVLEYRYTDATGAKVVDDVPNAQVESATDTDYYSKSVSLVPVRNAKIVAHASADVTAGNGVVYGRIYYHTIKPSELA
jgi:hypothetical protein